MQIQEHSFEVVEVQSSLLHATQESRAHKPEEKYLEVGADVVLPNNIITEFSLHARESSVYEQQQALYKMVSTHYPQQDRVQFKATPAVISGSVVSKRPGFLPASNEIFLKLLLNGSVCSPT